MGKLPRKIRLNILVNLKRWHLFVFLKVEVILVIKSFEFLFSLRAFFEHLKDDVGDPILAVDVLGLVIQCQSDSLHGILISKVH